MFRKSFKDIPVTYLASNPLMLSPEQGLNDSDCKARFVQVLTHKTRPPATQPQTLKILSRRITALEISTAKAVEDLVAKYYRLGPELCFHDSHKHWYRSSKAKGYC